MADSTKNLFFEDYEVASKIALSDVFCNLGCDLIQNHCLVDFYLRLNIFLNNFPDRGITEIR